MASNNGPYPWNNLPPIVSLPGYGNLFSPAQNIAAQYKIGQTLNIRHPGRFGKRLIGDDEISHYLCAAVARELGEMGVRTSALPFGTRRNESHVLHTVWYDLPWFCQQDRTIHRDEFAEKFLNVPANDIALMIYARAQGGLVEFERTGERSPNTCESSYGVMGNSGVSLCCDRAYDMVNDMLRSVARLAYYVTTAK
jgi:hypothetical protein